MNRVNLKHLDIDSNNELIPPETFSNLTLGDYTYMLKNIIYSVEEDPSKTVTFEVTSTSNITINYQLLPEYIINLDMFGIKNDGTAPLETAIGINNALQYAKQNGFTKVILPFGEYCISEDISIVMVDNITLDLNQSTLKINPNGKQKSTIIDFTGCKNAKLTNGTILGDRYQHDYNTISGSHEWNCAVVFNDCEYCELENITVKSATGYGISSSLGKNISNLIIGVTKFNLAIGGISNFGVTNNNTGTIRTIQPMDISKTGEEFELGYNKGYMGYPFMSARIYDSYFYDKNMKFISSSTMCQQYKKVAIPKYAVFVHFVFHQSYVPARGDTDFNSTTVFLTNYRSPFKITIKNCLIDDNRCLGMGLCGGREFLIENNTLTNNKGGAPGYAIDMEDGWEYMDNYIFRGNNFINNANDVVICAGDNITFEGNHFTNTVYMWERTTNYKFINNKFENINPSINYAYSSDTICMGNTYINCKIGMMSINTAAKITIDNEILINTSINSMSNGEVITNSTITSDATISIRLAGTYRGCTINCLKGDYISTQFTQCKITGTNLNCQGNTSFENCEFINSSNSTTSNTIAIKATNCKFLDSKFSVATWGKASIIDIQNSEINMLSATDSFIYISAGKMADLIFKNNKVLNQIAKPVFNLYDTTYSTPNGDMSLENSSFTLTKYGYVFDGVNIRSGVFTFTASNNSITGAVLLHPRYLNNAYFIIK